MERHGTKCVSSLQQQAEIEDRHVGLQNTGPALCTARTLAGELLAHSRDDIDRRTCICAWKPTRLPLRAGRWRKGP